MAEGKHTPGPWAFDEDEMAVSAAVGVQICTVAAADDFPCLDPDEDDTGKVEAECRANGHLLAAAPAMLAGFRQIAEPYANVTDAMLRLVASGQSTRLQSNIGQEVAEHVLLARATIAKAEGQAHG